MWRWLLAAMGLLHISELADEKVRRVSDIVQVGEVVPVKLLEIDDRDRLRLSRRAALADIGRFIR